jgi:hypothetical protein
VWGNLFFDHDGDHGELGREVGLELGRYSCRQRDDGTLSTLGSQYRG